MTADTYTLTEVLPRKIVGVEYEKVWTLDITSYDGTNGTDLTPAELGFSRLTGLEIQLREKAVIPKWDGSLTAPKIRVYSQEPTNAGAGVLALTEVADTFDCGEFRIVARGPR